MGNLDDYLWGEKWQASAVCGAMDPDIFFDLTTAPQRARAVAICRECPVKDTCLEQVLCSPWEPSGVFAGHTQTELQKMWRKRHPMTSPTERYHEITALIGVVA